MSQAAARCAALCCVAVLAACGEPAAPLGKVWQEPFTPATAALGDFTVEWLAPRGGPVLRVSFAGRAIWESLPGQAFVTGGAGRERVTEARGSFTIQDAPVRRCPDQRVAAVEHDGETIVVRGELACDRGATGYALRFSLASDHRLRFEVALDDPSLDRVYLTYGSRAAERFFGFGEQFTWFDLKGARVPIFVMEQGIGRGSFPLTLGANLSAGSGGDWHTSYASVPHYISSDLRSLYLESTEPPAFDLRDADRVTVELFAGRMAGGLVAGDSPLELIEEYTRYAGRMRKLPGWILSGAVIGMQGGTERVRQVREQLAAHDVPVAAFWLQDWVGQRTTSFGKQLWWNWELDRDRYPGWEQLVADLRSGGIRTLTYVNPFLADIADKKPNLRRNLFEEARSQGFLVRREGGEPYLVQNTDFSAALVDLTNPEARAWMKKVLRDEVIGAGASGWMADFGEALPYDAVLASGTAREFHNRYPEEWAQLNREAIEEAGLGDEAVFFTRSGFTRSPGRSTLFWLGDQTVSWDEFDGIKSAVTGMLSSGMSGFSLNHSDIGGYTAIRNPLQSYRRNKELLQRWTELAAFTPVFRTHEGNRPDENHQIFSDEDTLEHFARLAKVYQAWAPYRAELVAEAAKTGHPVVRHLFVHYPDDPNVLGLRYEEFLVGTELLVAPVLDPGRDEVRAYLPAGEWVHLWTGERFGNPERGSFQTVKAPIGRPAVFFRSGSAVGQRFRAQLAAEGLL